MMTKTLALTEFLLARIAEDEDLLEREDRVYGGGGEVWTVDAHDRALADIKARRRIVEMHAPYRRIYGLGCAVCLLPSGPPPDAEGWPCATLREFATVYAEHPGYRDEWKP